LMFCNIQNEREIISDNLTAEVFSVKFIGERKIRIRVKKLFQFT
jgi:hypothetical protein